MAIFAPEIRDRIRNCGVAAVLIIEDARNAVRLAKALLKGGIDAMELTLRTPAALDSIRAISDSVPEMLVGAGTVISPVQVAQVAEAGAAFAVSPGVNSDVLSAAADAGLPFAPGIMTPTDIETALTHECQLLKFFPAESSGGLPHLKNIAAPYRHLGLEFIPLGGLTEKNMATYLAEPLVAAVGGSWLAKPDVIKSENWALISETAAAAKGIAASARH